MTQTNKGQFVQYPLHLIYERKDLNRDDKWVLISMMGSCWSEGWHRLSYREISALSEVPITLLTSYKDKTGRQHEGILDRLARLGDISIDRCKEVNPMTGKPKGQPQTYIRINYQSLWQQNIEYCTKKPATSEPYKVNEGEYQSVSNANTSVSITNTLVSNTNAGVSNANESVCVSPSEVTTYITDNIDTTDKNPHADALASRVLPQENENDNHYHIVNGATPVAVVTTRNSSVQDITQPPSQNKLLEFPLSVPDMHGKWNDDKVVQYAEWCHNKRYAEVMRDEQLKAAAAIHAKDRTLTLEQYKQAHDRRFDAWWKEKKRGKLHVSDMKARGSSGIDRVHEMLEQIETQPKGQARPPGQTSPPSSDTRVTIDRKWLHEHPV